MPHKEKKPKPEGPLHKHYPATNGEYHFIRKIRREVRENKEELRFHMLHAFSLNALNEIPPDCDRERVKQEIAQRLQLEHRMADVYKYALMAELACEQCHKRLCNCSHNIRTCMSMPLISVSTASLTAQMQHVFPKDTRRFSMDGVADSKLTQDAIAAVMEHLMSIYDAMKQYPHLLARCDMAFYATPVAMGGVVYNITMTSKRDIWKMEIARYPEPFSSPAPVVNDKFFQNIVAKREYYFKRITIDDRQELYQKVVDMDACFGELYFDDNSTEELTRIIDAYMNIRKCTETHKLQCVFTICHYTNKVMVLHVWSAVHRPEVSHAILSQFATVPGRLPRYLIF